MKKITFIRHCESEYNLAFRQKKMAYNKKITDPAFIDCGLTKHGKEQAQQITGNFDIIILSPMRRCKETFMNSKLYSPQICVEPLFREYKTNICDFLHDEPIVEETKEELASRIEQLKKRLTKFKPEEKICIISHANLFYHMFNKWLGNGEIVEFTV